MANSTDLFQPTLCKLAKVHSQQVSYLKAQEAGGVVIVSAIKRAANEKVAQDMLGERFRRQLLGDIGCGAEENAHAGENTQSRRKHTRAGDGEGWWEGGREGVGRGRERGQGFWERLVGRRVSGREFVRGYLFWGGSANLA